RIMALTPAACHCGGPSSAILYHSKASEITKDSHLYRAGLSELSVTKSLPAPAVCCSGWFGVPQYPNPHPAFFPPPPPPPPDPPPGVLRRGGSPRLGAAGFAPGGCPLRQEPPSHAVRHRRQLRVACRKRETGRQSGRPGQ